MIRLQPPDPFNFRNPDDWPRWKNRFQQFRDASGLSSESESKQVSTFLYCLGEEAESVLASTGVTPDDRKEYDTVLEKVDGFFQVRKNVIYERALFNRSQQSGESAEQYIMALYELVQHCDYGGMKDEMIRDRLVVGIRDSSLSEKLQLDPALTLEKAKKLFARVKPFMSSRKCSKETVSQQQSIISMQCSTDNRAIVRVTIKDSDEIPTPTEINDEKQLHALERETCVVEINVGGVEVIDIHELNALQRMKYAITAE